MPSVPTELKIKTLGDLIQKLSSGGFDLFVPEGHDTQHPSPNRQILSGAWVTQQPINVTVMDDNGNFIVLQAVVRELSDDDAHEPKIGSKSSVQVKAMLTCVQGGPTGSSSDAIDARAVNAEIQKTLKAYPAFFQMTFDGIADFSSRQATAGHVWIEQSA